MRLLVRVCGAVASVAMAVFAGCGGNVILDSGAGGTGGGGTGGGTSSTTSTSTTTTTTSISTTSITTTTTSITTTTTSISTTSTGPSTCDNSGECGDGQFGCIGCSFNADCAQSYNDCINEQECLDYSNCLAECQNSEPMCQQQCGDQYPLGGKLYEGLVFCVFCVACVNDCGQGANCPN